MVGLDSSASILIVNDQPQISQELAQLLSGNGWEVFVESDPTDAIESISNRPIDLVLMEIDFGEGQMDGGQAARLILQEHDTPIVFWTDHTEQRCIHKIDGIPSYGLVTGDSGDFVLIQSVTTALQLFRMRVALEGKIATLESPLEKVSAVNLDLEQLFDGLPSTTALLDDSGTILMVNRAWRQFAEENGVPSDTVSEGNNYLRVCDEARGENSAEAPVFAAAIRDILAGKRDYFSMVYPCHSPDTRRWFSGKVSPVRVNDKRYVAIAHEDISELKETAERLRETEADLKLAQRIGRIGSFKRDLQTDELWWSDEHFVIFGVEKQQPTLNLVKEMIHPDDYERWEEAVAGSLERKESLVIDHRIVRPDGKTVCIHSDSQLVLDDDGQPLMLIGTVQDVTERKETEAELKRSKERYQLLFENASDAIVIYQDGETKLFNQKTLDITGYTTEEYKDLSIADLVHPDDQALLYERYRKRIAGEISDEPYEYRLITKTGMTKWVRINPARIIWNGEPAVLGIAGDVTRQKMLERELRAALEEKDFLMREIDHRVKNNLMMVSALVNLKDGELGDLVDLSGLSRQIDTIMTVHQKLHQSAEIEHIDFQEYVEDLLGSVFSFIEKPVRTEVDIEPIRFRSRTVIPLGLIINEIATNAIKHGFSSDDEAHFRVALTSDSDDRVHILTLANSGASFPADIVLDDPVTLGLRLITLFVDQLEGTIELAREPNPRFTIRFPLQEE